MNKETFNKLINNDSFLVNVFGRKKGLLLKSIRKNIHTTRSFIYDNSHAVNSKLIKESPFKNSIEWINCLPLNLNNLPFLTYSLFLPYNIFTNVIDILPSQLINIENLTKSLCISFYQEDENVIKKIINHDSFSWDEFASLIHNNKTFENLFIYSYMYYILNKNSSTEITEINNELKKNNIKLSLIKNDKVEIYFNKKIDNVLIQNIISHFSKINGLSGWSTLKEIYTINLGEDIKIYDSLKETFNNIGQLDRIYPGIYKKVNELLPFHFNPTFDEQNTYTDDIFNLFTCSKNLDFSLYNYRGDIKTIYVQHSDDIQYKKITETLLTYPELEICFIEKDLKDWKNRVYKYTTTDQNNYKYNYIYNDWKYNNILRNIINEEGYVQKLTDSYGMDKIYALLKKISKGNAYYLDNNKNVFRDISTLSFINQLIHKGLKIKMLYKSPEYIEKISHGRHLINMGLLFAMSNIKEIEKKEKQTLFYNINKILEHPEGNRSLISLLDEIKKDNDLFYINVSKELSKTLNVFKVDENTEEKNIFELIVLFKNYIKSNDLIKKLYNDTLVFHQDKNDIIVSLKNKMLFSSDEIVKGIDYVLDENTDLKDTDNDLFMKINEIKVDQEREIINKKINSENTISTVNIKTATKKRI